MGTPITMEQAKRIIQLQDAIQRRRHAIILVKGDTAFKVETGRRDGGYRELLVERVSGRIADSKLGKIIVRELIAIEEAAIAGYIRELNQLGGAIPVEAAS